MVLSPADTLAVATIMEAIKEQTVMAEDTVILSTDLQAKIENLSKELRGEIAMVGSETQEALETANQELKLQTTSLRSLEDGVNHYSDRLVELESQLSVLSSQVNQLTFKTEDLESRQHKDNCCIIGVDESLRDICMERSVAKLLQDSLGLEYTPTLDHAHRSLLPKPKQGDPPQAIIVKFQDHVT